MGTEQEPGSMRPVSIRAGLLERVLGLAESAVLQFDRE